MSPFFTLLPSRLRLLLGLLAAFSGWAPLWGQEPAAQPGLFGSEKVNDTALIGILYDLKQNQEREPTVGDVYLKTAAEFVREGWDESILNRFYRVTKPLYTTQIFIPIMGAEAAPSAFKVEKTVKPSRWIVHYKGQVSPPHAGTYRFVGLCDDLLAVAVNGQTILIGEYRTWRLKNHGWRDAPRDGPKTPSGDSVYGDWITLKQGEIVDLDIIIGEYPGGKFGGWVLIQEKGVDYPLDGAGKPILPVFQLAALPINAQDGKNVQATAAKENELWVCHQ